MAIDPRNLRPSDLARLLNSTPLGTVINERQLYRHRTRAGFRIGDGKRVDLFRYVTWLVDQRHVPKEVVDHSAEYEAIKERAAARAKAISLGGRDIGEMPGVVNPDRKAQAANDFRFFCQSYFPLTFTLKWAPDHLRAIAKIEQAVMHGGLFALAMPRGSGKTSIAECACLWAVLYGHRDFVCLIGASEVHALEMLDSIKMELVGNDLLAGDFPEAIHPIVCLDGIANRCSGQLYKGQRTHIGWTSNEIVLPTIPGSKSSAALIKVAGITGRIRGMKYKRADGQSVRPSLVILDDPQTDESAQSLSQCLTRTRILAGAVLGLAGPGRKISGVMPCTVIRPGDMADTILDRDRHPEWQGERTKMVYSFPRNEKLWAKYNEIRSDSLRNDGDGSEATEFYRAHRGEMDAGARVAWPQRHNEDEISAIQHAMNLRFRDEAAFFAEYQNEPIVEEIGHDMLTADEIAAKVNGYQRGDISINCQHLTMFIDLQQKALFWMLCAWEENYTGYIVDYGTWPEQRRAHFTLRDLTATLGRATPGAGLEGQLYAGLEKLAAQKLPKAYRREDGADLRIDRCLIDANWGQSTEVVYQFCRQSKFAGVLMPSHGKYVGASSKPFAEYVKKRGERVGLHWRIPATKGRRQVRYVLIDTNYWKSFVHERLAVSMGDPGCLSLFGRDEKLHRLFSEHLTAEYRVQTEARGRVVDEWKLHANRPDNHWLDCLVGCAVAASLQGASLAEVAGSERVDTRRRISLAKLQQEKRWKR